MKNLILTLSTLVILTLCGYIAYNYHLSIIKQEHEHPKESEYLKDELWNIEFMVNDFKNEKHAYKKRLLKDMLFEEYPNVEKLSLHTLSIYDDGLLGHEFKIIKELYNARINLINEKASWTPRVDTINALTAKLNRILIDDLSDFNSENEKMINDYGLNIADDLETYYKTIDKIKGVELTDYLEKRALSLGLYNAKK